MLSEGGIHIVESHQQIDHRGFTRSGGADDQPRYARVRFRLIANICLQFFPLPVIIKSTTSREGAAGTPYGRPAQRVKKRWVIHAVFVGLIAAEAKEDRRPVLVVQDGQILDYNTSAKELGITPFKTLIEALRLAPDALVVDFHPRHHRKWIDTMQDILRGWTPWLKIVSDQEWYAAFYSEHPREQWRELFARLKDRLPDRGWRGYSGLAGRPSTAEAISLRIVEEGLRAFSPPSRMAVLPVSGAWVEDDAEFVRHLPLRFFRHIPPQIKEEMERLGVHTGEQLTKIPPVLLQRRFGPEALTWQHFAAGELGDSFVPRDPGKTLSQTWVAPAGEAVPTESTELLLDLLCDALVKRLEREQVGIQGIAIQWTDDEGNRVWEQHLFPEVLAHPEGIRRSARVLNIRLRSRHPEITRISGVQLTATHLHPFRGEQVSWLLRGNEFYPPLEFRQQTWRFLIDELGQKYPRAPIRFGLSVPWRNQRQAWWDPWQNSSQACGSPPNPMKGSQLSS
ncbi:hypothetical protein CVV65_11080 [Kyrpidia spormannii]|uniref:UmuC domain-containing protein n=1 Tax=Kyrpidia spormannii TaxID=2055160 RepID=A0A2K8NAD5_9BACL|nr:hypothetical protein CVV65_11080 [Kyrpidia spormannii]